MCAVGGAGEDDLHDDVARHPSNAFSAALSKSTLQIMHTVLQALAMCSTPAMTGPGQVWSDLVVEPNSPASRQLNMLQRCAATQLTAHMCMPHSMIPSHPIPSHPIRSRAHTGHGISWLQTIMVIMHDACQGFVAGWPA